MSKFRSAIIAFTLTIIFLIPMSAIPEKTSEPVEEENTFAEKTPVPENNTPEPFFENEIPDGYFRILDIESGDIINVSFYDYVKGAIASEMGAAFEFEALVAQGTAAFSCGLYQKDIHSSADYDFSAAPDKKLGYMTEEKAKEVYGKDFDEKWNIISSAAKKGLEYVICYEEKPALTVYHAISNGTTESSENAWGGALPYLVPVKSPGDLLSPDYETEVSFSFEETLEILNKSGAGLSGKNPEEWFSGAIRTESGYVDKITIGAATFSGERLRSIFNLRSTDFDVYYKNGEFVFTVRGYGHGVGLSQVGADEMAKKGADFEEILMHYYPGTELVNYEDIK